MPESSSPTEALGLWFKDLGHAELRPEAVAPCGPGEVTVRAVTSLISAGSEMLAYRGMIDLRTQTLPPYCRGSFGFPLKFGYQIVGVVEAAGAGARHAPGELVFVRHPHQTRFTVTDESSVVFAVPAGLPPDRAVFAGLMAVALTGLHDAAPRMGDCVAVYGAGVVGHLIAALARRVAGQLIVIEPDARRRQLLGSLGVDAVVTPDDAPAVINELSSGRGADVCFEASGAPPALQAALSASAHEATICVVSYYGTQTVPLLLSPEFHLRRLRLVSSWVGRIGGGLEPRWDFERRAAVAMGLLSEVDTSALVTQRIPFCDAQHAYALLAGGGAGNLAVLLDYDGPV